MGEFARARDNMVLSQLRPGGVRDERVVSAMSAVPREAFVSEYQRPIAYIDADLSVGEGRYLMEPLVFAHLLSAAKIDRHDIVLDVGCGTGYSTAVLARLADTVVALESSDELTQRADKTLEELGVDNAVVVCRPLKQGYSQQGPYNVIVIEGTIPSVSDELVSQLDEGGRLVAVVGSSGIGRCTLIERIEGLVSSRTVMDAAVPELPEFSSKTGFIF